MKCFINECKVRVGFEPKPSIAIWINILSFQWPDILRFTRVKSNHIPI